jgi:signal transduction histidine kinase
MLNLPAGPTVQSQRDQWKHLDPSGRLLTHDRLICDRLRLDCLSRFAVSATIAAGGLSARYLVGITGLNLGGLMASAAVITGYNLVTWWIIRPYRDPGCAEQAYRFLSAVRHVTIALDYLALTVLVYLVGGARSPILPVFLLHVVMSSLLGSRRAAFVHALLAYLLMGGLVVSEWAGWLEPDRPPGAVCGYGPLDGRYALGLLVVYGFLFIVTGALVTGLAHTLRIGERVLVDANHQLARLSQIRRDFLHVALHNLQAPVSAATMMLETLEQGGRGSLGPEQLRWVERSLERIRGSAQFLRDLQMLATLEGEDLTPQAQPVDIGAAVRAAAADTRDLAEARRHVLDLDVPDELPPVHGIERLLREAVVNYLTNAIKYTPEGGHSVLRVRAEPGSVRVEVEDDGIGIAPEEQAKLFHEFVRILRDPRVAATPGTGLGLSITRRIVEAHGGTVSLLSEPGKGSVFALTLPVGASAAPPRPELAEPEADE